MMNRNAVDVRLVGTFVCLVVSCAALVTHRLGTLVPYLPVLVGLGMGAVALGAALDDDAPAWPYLCLVAGLSVFHRVYAVAFVPTLIGFDPDGYAELMQQVIADGTARELSVYFYGSAPVHVLQGAAFSLAAGVGPVAGTVLFPVALGVLVPLFGALFTRMLGGNDAVQVAGAALAAMAGITVNFTSVPIAQTSALVFLFLGYLALARYGRARDWRFLVVFLVAVSLMALTHKLPVFVVAGALGVVSLLSLVDRYERGLTPITRVPALTLVAVAACVLVLQGLFLTNYLEGRVYRLWLFLAVDQSVAPVAFDPPAAFDAYTRPRRLRRLGYLVALMATAGIGWLFVAATRRHEREARTLLSVAAVCVALSVFGFLGGLANPLRTILAGETVFVALVVTLLSQARRHLPGSTLPTFGSVLVFALLLSTMSVTTFAAPDDGSNHYRPYLTEPEVEAKQFALTHVDGTVHTDLFYVHESPAFVINAQRPGGGTPFPAEFRTATDGYLNGTLHRQGHPVVAHRTDLNIYRTDRGIYELTWRPEPALDRRYHRVFDNGDVVLYGCRTCRAGSGEGSG
ncbi:hypothetical protein [Halosimplex marinum]|uniref:hypothetical protein n=1 Tax=Halosimplex marinum TaxID=3396620 RepID=UPI003F575CA8